MTATWRPIASLAFFGISMVSAVEGGRMFDANYTGVAITLWVIALIFALRVIAIDIGTDVLESRKSVSSTVGYSGIENPDACSFNKKGE